MGQKLITESTFDLTITESKESKSLYIMGVFSSAGVLNKNGRVYPKPILEREIKKVSETVKECSCTGQLGHPESPESDLEKIAILTEELTWKGNDVYGKAKVLDTPSGRILRDLIKEGVRVGISSRGLGTVNNNGEVNEDFDLICWDCVSKASNPKSRWVNGVFEGKTFDTIVPQDKLIKEVLDEHYKKIWQVIQNFKKGI